MGDPRCGSCFFKDGTRWCFCIGAKNNNTKDETRWCFRSGAGLSDRLCWCFPGSSAECDTVPGGSTDGGSKTNDTVLGGYADGDSEAKVHFGLAELIEDSGDAVLGTCDRALVRIE